MSEEVENGVLDLLDVEPDQDAEGEEQAEPETPDEQEPEGDKGEAEPPPDSTDDEEPQKGVDPQHAAMLAKAEDANRKFQEQRDRADQLQQELDDLKKSPPPDPIEDPEAFKDWQQSQAEDLRGEFSKELREAKFEMARLTVMSLKDDYEEVEKVFIEEAKNNPTLQRLLGEAANPALFAYEQGQKIMALNQDPEAMREQIRAEERAKLEAELKDKQEQQDASDAEKEAALKPSIADTGNAGLGDEAPVGLDTVAEMTGEDATRRKR